LVLLENFLVGGTAHIQVVRQAVLQAVHPAVHGEFLAVFPGVLHDGGFADMQGLLNRVEFAETVGESPDTIDVGDLAMLVQDAGLRIGRNRLFQWLRQNKMLRPNNKPYQSYVNQGWFDLIETTKKSGARSSLFVKTVVTGKGQLAIVERLRREVAA
jgi:phage antirepressor YoqD-like protein